MNEFDEYDAIAYIRQEVVEAKEYSDDDLLLLIDTTFDYYESMDEDAPDEMFSEEAVAAYVSKQLAQDKECRIAAEHVLPILRAENAYEDTLDEQL